MERETYKARKIIEELMSYFLKHGLKKITIELDMNDERTYISLNGKSDYPVHDIDQLVELMNATRRPELEEYYENLLGNSYSDYDLDLIGAMVDRAHYKCEGDRLWMDVIRYIDSDY